MEIKKIACSDMPRINQVVGIHLETFQGFFLSFMGRGFLNIMYKSYVEYKESGILAAYEANTMVGFLAFSGDMSGLYKYMIKKRLILFAWYSIGAFFRKPTVFVRLVSAFLKPSECRRKEKYMELSSIGVYPLAKSKGIGSSLISALKASTDFSKYQYVTLETDALNNDSVNHFYQKNGFVLVRQYKTNQGRMMNEYQFRREV